MKGKRRVPLGAFGSVAMVAVVFLFTELSSRSSVSKTMIPMRCNEDTDDQKIRREIDRGNERCENELLAHCSFLAESRKKLTQSFMVHFGTDFTIGQRHLPTRLRYTHADRTANSSCVLPTTPASGIVSVG